MSWLSFLTDKPWLPQPAGAVPELGGAARSTAPKVALMFLLVVITTLFMLIFVTFISRSQYQDFQALAGEPWQPFTDAWRLWINTAVLLAASVAMHFAVRAVRTGQNTYLWRYLWLGAGAAALFLVLQVVVWRFLLALGYGVNTNPANSYFYMLTGLHGLHLAGGLAALGRVLVKYRARAQPGQLKTAVESCATYWHYLFVLWLVLFFLLTRTPDAYALIAAACGLG